MIEYAIAATLLVAGGYGGYKVYQNHQEQSRIEQTASSVRELNGLMQAHGNGSQAVSKVDRIVQRLPKDLGA